MPLPTHIPSRKRARALALGLMLAGCASLAAAPSAREPYLENQYSLNAVAIIPTPPDAGTQEERIDRESSYIIYAERTPEQIARAKAEAQLTIFNFESVLGVNFKQGKYPKTEALIAQIENEANQITLAAQKYWQRPLPAQVDSARFSDTAGAGEKVPGSYPSARATRATVYALLLGEVYPKKRDALLAHGRSIGWRHVQCGGATPLDFYAGRVLGRAIVQGLIHNPKFLADFEEMRAELRPPAPAAPAPAAPAQAK